MATLATDLIRTTARAFYQTEHILVIEALVIHSTLPDKDLCHLLGMQSKHLHRLCGRLREDGLLSVQVRSERRADGSGSFHPPTAPGQQPKERLTTTQWYFLNFHRAIDSIKYRMYKLNKHVESLGAPSTEKKDLLCRRCKAQWTELEVMDKIDPVSGSFLCGRCGYDLDHVEEDERASENESMKRLNSQLEKILTLMQKIDQTTVPENDFQEALGKQVPIVRTDANPGQKTEIIDLDKHNLQGSKGLALKPERIDVQLQDDEDVKRANREAEAQARRDKEARQNALPEWIAKSTVTGDITAVGAKEDRLRREREIASGGAIKPETDGEEKKPAPGSGGDEDVMAAYWEEMERANAKEAADQAAEDQAEDDDDDEDDFEDVLPTSTVAKQAVVSGADTPAAVESSNATDDEREVKRVKTGSGSGVTSNGTGGEAKVEAEMVVVVEGTPAASDEDEDDLEFESVM